MGKGPSFFSKSIENLEDMTLKELNELNCTFGEQKITDEVEEVSKGLHEMINIRKKYIYGHFYPWEKPTVDQVFQVPKSDTILNTDSYGNLKTPALPYDPFDLNVEKTDSKDTFEMKNGVYTVKSDDGVNYKVPSFDEYFEDFTKLMDFSQQASARTHCFKRLKVLDLKFQLHNQLHSTDELMEQKNVPHRDFYNVRKVDTHVHLASSMNQKHLLRFIKKKIKESPDEKVISRDGKTLTLKQVFESLNLTPYDLSVDTLDVHADNSIFHRFDKFNLKYNPCGQSRLREIFLKTDNEIKGKYFGELIGETFQEFKDSKYQMEEPRVSIYGRKKNEWSELAKWVINSKLYCDNVRFMIQIPRLYDTHYKTKFVKSFHEMLENIFEPLFQVSRDPSVNPELHAFLQQVVGFDQVDDESLPEKQFMKNSLKPEEWNNSENPPYAYYAYYIYANLMILNQYRMKRGLHCFSFRPHSGEAGDINHLASAFLLSKGISHGIMLRKSPVLQYLYYLTQIGLAVSPLSNNFLFLNYDANPFPEFFQRGLNVSLSTDDPLMFHFTKEPLMEEYSVAAQVWHFSNADLCEIARNSVLQSGWEHLFKIHWLGDKYWLSGDVSNHIDKTNVPNIRMNYRHETLMDEHLFILKCLYLTKYQGQYKIPLSLKELMKMLKRDRSYSLQIREKIGDIVKVIVPHHQSHSKEVVKEEKKELKKESPVIIQKDQNPFFYGVLFLILSIIFNLFFKIEKR